MCEGMQTGNNSKNRFFPWLAKNPGEELKRRAENKEIYIYIPFDYFLLGFFLLHERIFAFVIFRDTGIILNGV